MAITQEMAKEDLEKILGKFSTIGTGTEQDRAAQMVLQTIGVLSRRLDNPHIIKMLYIDNDEAKALLPRTVYETAAAYVQGSISREQALATLTDAEKQYNTVFKEAGVTPQRSSVIFSR